MLKIKVDIWRPSRFKELGRGGEAAVYQMKDDIAAKVFLLPNAPEFRDNPGFAEAARVRIQEMQTKLFEFPENLPKELVAPSGVLVNTKKQVFGYVMPLIKGISLDKLGRTTSLLTPKLTGTLLTRLYDLVSALHAANIVIGDFNENNVVVKGNVPYLIDADSMQFGPYQCRSFIPRFVAPEILKFGEFPAAVAPKRPVRKRKVTTTPIRPSRKRKVAVAVSDQPQFVMVAPHSELSDWYSFLVIAMRLLTFTDPYGGVVQDMGLEERIEKRITVFDRRVIYPMVARPLRTVPRPLLEAFFRAFHRGERFVPVREIFSGLSVQ